jgi:hypothetical protein
MIKRAKGVFAAEYSLENDRTYREMSRLSGELERKGDDDLVHRCPFSRASVGVYGVHSM